MTFKSLFYYFRLSHLPTNALLPRGHWLYHQRGDYAYSRHPGRQVRHGLHVLCGCYGQPHHTSCGLCQQGGLAEGHEKHQQIWCSGNDFPQKVYILSLKTPSFFWVGSNWKNYALQGLCFNCIYFCLVLYLVLVL